LTFSNSALTLEARNSKTRLLLQRFWWTQAGSRTGAQWVANVGHRHGWGRGSSWSSYVSFVDGLGRRSLQWSETGRIYHARSVRSNLSFRYRNTRSEAANRSDWAVGYGLSYPVGPGLGASSNISSRWMRSRMEHRHELALGQSLGFGYNLFGPVRFDGGGSVQYLRGRAESTGEGLMDVLGETSVVGADGSFLLESPGVVPASIRVFSVDRALLYEAGLDYEILPSGAFTLLTLAPASRIGAPGRTLGGSTDGRGRRPVPAGPERAGVRAPPYGLDSPCVGQGRRDTNPPNQRRLRLRGNIGERWAQRPPAAVRPGPRGWRHQLVGRARQSGPHA
jgi:hypothetical protein